MIRAKPPQGKIQGVVKEGVGIVEITWLDPREFKINALKFNK